MPNKRDIKLDEYDISKFAYRELSNFCLQYPEKKKQLELLYHRDYLLKPTSCDDMPHGSGHSDPTAQAAERAAKLSADTELIEQAAIEADAGIYQYIILAVTQGVPYHFLKTLKNIPCSYNYYYKQRHRFFYLLAKKKGIL
jgi:hypothetical protein